jgi:hypothetical protein
VAEDLGPGGVAAKLATAVALGADFAAAGVPDTPGNRAMFESIKADHAKIPAGSVVAIPPE